MVDVLYERSVKMVCLAEAVPMKLFDPGSGRREDMPDEVFAFDRTVSRLAEMQGQEYLKRRVFRSAFVGTREASAGEVHSEHVPIEVVCVELVRAKVVGFEHVTASVKDRSFALLETEGVGLCASRVSIRKEEGMSD